MSGSASGKRGGTPSTTTPIAGPWLSPQVVNRNKVPNELPAIVSSGLWHHRDVGGVDGFHADDVITAIDVVNLAADPGRQVAQQIDSGAANLVDRNVAFERRIVLVPLEDVVEIADS